MQWYFHVTTAVRLQELPDSQMPEKIMSGLRQSPTSKGLDQILDLMAQGVVQVPLG